MIKNAWILAVALAFVAACASTETPKPAPQPEQEKEAPKPAPEAPKPASAPEKPKPVAEKVTFAADVLFDFDKSDIKPEGRSKLDDLAGKMKTINLEVVIAIGHTDSIGTDVYNQKLSVRRAEAVKKYLSSKGVEGNRIYTEGKGEKQPVSGDKCKGMGEDRKNKKLIDCLQPDRRVEIEVIGTRAP